MARSRKKRSREVSLYDPIGTDREGNEISLLDIIESPPVDIVEQYATQQDILRAAEISGAAAFIQELPKGYDTMVGERGTALSGGQRQRIAIARALITNPRILIFDEATSALDYESEHIIMNNLAQIAADRTMIMIAQRLSTVRHCDQILVMDHGRIHEQGTHEDLLQSQGIYHSLWMQQLAGTAY